MVIQLSSRIKYRLAFEFGHYNRQLEKMGLKVSQGGDRGDRINFLHYGWQKLDKSTFNNYF